MRLIGHLLRLSASDLMRFKGCRHATALDLRLIEVGDLKPDEDGPEAELLQKQGDDHELAFLDRLKADGHSVIEIPKDNISLEESVRLTLEAMRTGPNIIFQGALLDGAWGGYSDFLERVERPSDLGAWSYEVVDTKLKRRPDPKHVLQLCLYSDLIGKVQGVAPEAAHLQLGDGSRFTVRLSEVSAYARNARRMLEAFLVERPETRSEPVSACTLCRWSSHCAEQWDADDSLALVAGISRSQRQKLEAAGITTMAALVVCKDRVPKMAAETQRKLVSQARLQSARRAGGLPAFELRNAEPGKGFGLLPAPDEGDVFYDIEGDPYFPGGLEYLHGVWYREKDEWAFRAFWAHSREDEGRSVADLLTFLVEHMRRHPNAHIYHYANYEIAALRRLTAQHRTCEAAIDQLQRERRFVDLFKVVSGAMIASEKGYSIKDLEAFYMKKRAGDVATAGSSVVFYEEWRHTGEQRLLDEIHDYNRTDCLSTQLLRDWLVSDVRPTGMAWAVLGEVPEGGSLSNIEAEDEEIRVLRAKLQPVRERLGDQVADLLLDLSQFHKREDKPAYWAIFDRLAQESEELLDDLECIQGLEAVSEPVQVTKQSFERTYRFPQQETKLRAGKSPCLKPAAMPEDVNLRSIDHDTNTLVLRRSIAKGPLPDRLDLLPPRPLRNSVLKDAVAAVTEEIIANTGRVPAIEDILTRSRPRFVGGLRSPGVISGDGDLSIETSRAIAAMADSTLAIQGPPGTGKTYVSALSIVDLVRAGKRVAVSSNSHKAISNLLKAVADRARVEGMNCRLVQKTSDDGDEEAYPGIVFVSDNDAPEIASAHVVGATAWHFARYSDAAFDYLVVDEAGQVSLANILAMARSSRNIVLVGDPMQLPQPLQGSHPGDSGRSCLEYLIDGHRVVPTDRGIFIPVSRRMHPRVCGFISTAVYEGRLRSDDAARGQTLVSRTGIDLLGAGMRAVTHAGRSQVSPEEIQAIVARIAEVDGATYRDRDGRERVIGNADILVVAPYNAQVNALRAALPGAVRVGTVDRFQGQEAPICLVSMTTSSGEELPRDISFLFSLNRINVAVSRAQAAAMVFASPLLLQTSCRTIEEMSLVNALCILREYGGDSF
ncbi:MULTISPECIES: TM0106 family RecB-like putative nuclease [unclassified Rhizobium]|uniref:TM0106 family RecB-like putative nuclease n=1 Tax=unclassified Rhizobium TaxID=2613769 RepID=UPI001A982758|nr:MULTISPECIES: TM0106 family RecB-like putative nuclease [unclassified Rhizobium]MBX5164517.1 TM0106 family RecB-like putative nuclease [Rhizobium sp. NZLR4b]MBX5190833.1 TM0106 family RecB-like putative nuclease [Rhizobium sp. NZLR3b]MBX5204448.1 TM0106 family RecB-like putative nuclease [Rhizobium sp. NZLR1]QSZ24668.1 TM0106 family RecB-like putative nuclease [Rhizobium sp. NZLR1]